MKELFIMRHAKSSWDDTNQSDFYRDLKPRGISDAQLIAIRNKEALAKIELLCSSPAIRAKNTSLLVCKSIGFKSEEIQWIDDIYEASPHTLLNIVRKFHEKVNKAMIIGHNPGFTYVANYFLREPIDNLPTSGLVSLSFSTEKWSEISKNCLVFSSVDSPKNSN